MSEGLLAKYESLIEDNPSRAGIQLARFFGETFSVTTDGQLFGIFNKLVKMYGTTAVKFAILDCYDVENFNPKKPYPLLVYFIKKRAEEKNKHVVSLNLMSLAEEQEKQLGKVTKIVTRSFDE